jgi:hypothetical protein
MPMPQIVAQVAQLLAAVGELLLPGDRLITGSIAHLPVAAGEMSCPTLVLSAVSKL